MPGGEGRRRSGEVAGEAALRARPPRVPHAAHHPDTTLFV